MLVIKQLLVAIDLHSLEKIMEVNGYQQLLGYVWFCRTFNQIINYEYELWFNKSLSMMENVKSQPVCFLCPVSLINTHYSVVLSCWFLFTRKLSVLKSIGQS